MNMIAFQSGIACPECANDTAQVIGTGTRITLYRCPECGVEWQPGRLAALGRALARWWNARPLTLLLVLYLAAIASACLLTGCAPRTVYVDRPGPVQLVERRVYVNVPAALTAPLPIATGALSQCPAVARDRRAQLELGNVHLEAISKLSGQPVPAAP